ncbi:hypothetical protein DFH06DRAFT_1335597 [Mycena polygramma]|nr:hypothetical protein DFH06DRAFT_1335597 [Mycena polygramma]
MPKSTSDLALRPFLALARFWPYHCFPTRRVLPPELWSVIFAEYCDANTVRLYNKLRDELCKKFGLWATFIRFTPLFWTNIIIDRNSSVARTEFAIQCSRPLLLLQVVVVLDVPELPGDALDDSDAVALVATEYKESLAALSVVAQTSSRWSSLYTATSCDYLLESVVAILAGISVPKLNSFTFGCGFVSRKNARLFFGPPFLFKGSARSLQRLDVLNTPFPWQRRSYFSSLTEMRIIHVQRNDWPAACQLATALSASPNLDTLTIIASGVLQRNDVSPFVLPSLSRLAIAHGSLSMIRLLSAARTPLLHQLTLSYFAVHCWAAVVQSCSFLSTVTCLRVNQTWVGPELVDAMLLRTRSMVCLDVNDGAELFATCLARDPSLCPGLFRAALRDVPLDLVLSLVVERLPGLRMLSLTYSRPLPFDPVDDMISIVLEALVPNFALGFSLDVVT